MNTEELKSIVSDIYQRIQSKQVRLPSPPDIYLKVVQVTNDPESSIHDIESVIKYDASITARLIQVANSPALRGQKKTNTLGEALIRLGTKFTSTLILGLSLRDRFSLHNAELREAARQVWEHSVYTGVSTSILAKETYPEFKLSKEIALTAGLLHSIGKLPVIDYFSDNLAHMEYFHVVLDQIHADIGSNILSDWGLPIELVQCTRISPLKAPANLATPVSYADLGALTVAALWGDESGFIPTFEEKVGIRVDGVKHVFEEYATETQELVASLGIN